MSQAGTGRKSNATHKKEKQAGFMERLGHTYSLNISLRKIQYIYFSHSSHASIYPFNKLFSTSYYTG